MKNKKLITISLLVAMIFSSSLLAIGDTTTDFMKPVFTSSANLIDNEVADNMTQEEIRALFNK